VRRHVFQRDQAPVIAASGRYPQLHRQDGTLLPADFTLAPRYQFNGACAVRFTVAAPQRDSRDSIDPAGDVGTRGLPAGIVATCEPSFTYQRPFQRADGGAKVPATVVVETGIVDARGHHRHHSRRLGAPRHPRDMISRCRSWSSI